jgi:hypothetical protein
MTTRTRDHIRKPRIFPDHVAFLSTSTLETEPFIFRQKNISPLWQAVMQQEMDALHLTIITLLAASGFIASSVILMAPLNASKLGL